MVSNFRYQVIDRIFFTRWFGPPTRQDAQQLERLLKDEADKQGKPLLYVGSVASESRFPTSEERTVIFEIMTAARESQSVEAFFLFSDGNALQDDLLRLTMSGVSLMARANDGYTTITTDFDAIVERVSSRLQKDAAPLFAMAKTQSLVP